MGRWQNAETDARRAVEADPGFARARLQLAQVVLALGRPDESERLVKSALADEPSSSWGMRILGAIHQQRGQLTAALECAEHAVRMSGGDALCLLNLSEARQNVGDLPGARTTAQQLVSKFPDWPDAHVRLAATMHSPEEAERAYRTALRLDPQCDAALVGLAVANASLARYREALSLAWSSLRADVSDRARQRYFARSAWIYLALSRVAAPMRSNHRALAEPFGEACAHAFRATGSSTPARLWFAFPGACKAVAAWCALLACMIGAAFLPDDQSVLAVPLLGIPVFLGLLAPLVVGYKAVEAARRLLDARMVRRLGVQPALRIVVRALTSGVAMAVVAIVLLLALPNFAGIWGWLLVAGIVLGLQDVERWRNQWRDHQLAAGVGTLRERIDHWCAVKARRWLTLRRLVVFTVASSALEFGVLATGWPLRLKGPSLMFALALGALIAGGIGLSRRRAWGHRGTGPRTQRWAATGRALLHFLWLIAVAVSLSTFATPATAGRDIEALMALVWLPFMCVGAWLAYQLFREVVACLAGEVTAALGKS